MSLKQFVKKIFDKNKTYLIKLCYEHPVWLFLSELFYIIFKNLFPIKVHATGIKNTTDDVTASKALSIIFHFILKIYYIF